MGVTGGGKKGGRKVYSLTGRRKDQSTSRGDGIAARSQPIPALETRKQRVTNRDEKVELVAWQRPPRSLWGVSGPIVFEEAGGKHVIDMEPTNQASRAAGKGGKSRKRRERAGAGHTTNHTWRESSTQMIDKLSDPWEEQGGKNPRQPIRGNITSAKVGRGGQGDPSGSQSERESPQGSAGPAPGHSDSPGGQSEAASAQVNCTWTA